MKRQDNGYLFRLLGIQIPIIQAPMAGVDTVELAAAVTRAGGLGSLACAMLTPEGVRASYLAAKSRAEGPVNLNFFCHRQQAKSAARQERWIRRLLPYYAEYNIDPASVTPPAARVPFDEAYCRVIEEVRPPVVSFHFGLPAPDLLKRVKATGAVILSSATTVGEGVWLEKQGCDVVIAQGSEAGGHRGMFLSDDLYTQLPTADLTALLTKKISIPVVAAGGICDADTVNRSFAWGASAAQLGTAYLFCREARVAALHRQALTGRDETVLTNVFSGRPARGILNRFVKEVGPISGDVPDFPYASDFVAPLRKASEAAGSTDFMQLWSGGVRKPHDMDAYDFTVSIGRGL